MIPKGWERLHLRDIAQIKAGATPLRSAGSRYFDNEHGVPWVKTMDLNNSEIYETDECITDLALKETSCCIFSANTVLVAMYGGFRQIGRTGILKKPAAVNQAISALQLDEERYNPLYILNYLNGNVEKWRRFAASSRKDPNITREDVCGFPILLPPVTEQRKIAKILSTWDETIAATAQLLANSKQQKKALMQQLLTGKKRLPGFGRPGRGEFSRKSLPEGWDYDQIGNIAVEVSERNKGQSDIPVLSCSKYDGFVDSLKYFKKKVYSDDTSNYKIIKRGEFGFPANHIEEGSIGLQSCYERGIVSPIYVVFRVDKSRVDEFFLYNILKSDHYRQVFSASTSASVDRRGSLRWKQFSAIRVPLPILDEQVAISQVVREAEKEEQLIKSTLEKLREEKKALMQQLLTGKRRVKIDDAERASA